MWLNAFNLKYKENILYVNSLFKPNLNDGWLSGFTEKKNQKDVLLVLFIIINLILVN